MRRLQRSILVCVTAALFAAWLEPAAAVVAGQAAQPRTQAGGEREPTRRPRPPAPQPPPPPPPPPPPAPSDTPAVGRTPGHAAVSPAGEAVYSVPLELPRGTNGLTPALSLEYRHTVRDGALGAGWSLGGLTLIARCPRSIAQDGAAGAVRGTREDRFCLDGQRLVLVNGAAYGDAGAEYRTEIDRFARIRAIGVAGAGPRSFEVETADGRLLEYGATPDSRIDWAGRVPTPRAWALNRMSDRSGNVVDYEYLEDEADGSFRLLRLRYNANPAAGVAASHEVALVYGPRPPGDVTLHFVANEAVRQRQRLLQVNVLHDGELLKRYELGYEDAPSTAGRSRLATLRECGRDAAQCLAPTLLSWQDGVPGLATRRDYPVLPEAAAWIAESKRWWTGDINGDGRDDLVWSGGGSAAATLRYRLALATGALGEEVDTRIAAPNGAGVPLDYDGDGAADALTISPQGRWQVVLGGERGLGSVIDTLLEASPIDYRGADLDGDGLSDLVYSERIGNSGNGLVVRVRYNVPGAGFRQAPVTLYEQGFDAGYDWPEGGNFLGRPGRRIDLDGDGREDLLMNEEYSIARISADRRQSDRFASSFAGGVPADVNGDGCTDFVYPHYQGSWRVRFSGCSVDGPSGLEVAGPRYEPLRHAVFAFDWDGDGRDDLLYGDAASNWKLVRSLGESLAAAVDSGVAHAAATSVAVADFDGNGLQDLAARSGGGIGLNLHRGPAPDLLLGVEDGFGVRAAFAYAPATDPAVYTKSTGAVYPLRDLQDARMLVSTLSVSDGSGTGNLAVHAYHYLGLRSDPTRRGDHGFAQRRVRQQTPAGLVLEETRRQDFPFTGLLSREVLRDAAGSSLRDATYSWRSLSTGNGASLRRHPYLAASELRVFEPGGSGGGEAYLSTTMTVAAIDSLSGLVTDRSIAVVEGAGGVHPGAARIERLQHQSIMNDAANWCLGRPLATTLTVSHTLPGGEVQTRSSTLDWDGAACRPKAAQLEPGDPELQLSVDLGYDAFGNLSRRTLTGIGMAPRTATLDWGAQGRFAERLSNPLAQATTIAWDAASGLPLAMRDANGLTTRIDYDAFGRIASRSTADGRQRRWQRLPCADDCDPRARYRLRVEETSAAGEVLDSQTAEVDQFERLLKHAQRRPGGGWAEQLSHFDAWGRLVTESLPAWAGGAAAGQWQYSYDVQGRQTRAVLHAADGTLARSLQREYDGLAIETTAADGQPTRRRLSAWGDTLEVRDPLGGSTRYDYDAFGQLLRVQDALGNRLAEISWNRRGMKVAQYDMDAGAWTISRDALGQAIELRDAKGQTTRFDYDALGRVTQRIEAEGVSRWTWGNSAAAHDVGRLVTTSGPGYAESYAYDALSRLARRTITADASYQYDYGYDAAGRLDALTYPASGAGFRLKLGYEYADGGLLRIRALSEPGTVFWELGAVDAAGRVLDESLGGALRVVSGFSPVTGELEYRQAGLGGGAGVSDLAYRWDAAGRLVARSDAHRGSHEDFDYDAAGRLSRASGVSDLDLRYDLAGNTSWKSDVCAGSADCFAYDARRRHAVTTAGDGRYAYDANGNMVSRPGGSISWYSYNLPRSLGEGAQRSEFWYGPARNRWKQLSNDAGIATTTVYAGDLLQKVTRAGRTSWRHYVEAPTGRVAVYIRHADGSAPDSWLLTQDHLGGTHAIVDAVGKAVLLRQAFDPFGRRRGGSLDGVPGFAGHEQLDHLGLIHMSGRVYDPLIGRFISPDPLVSAPFDARDLDRYSYAWNDPLAVADPSGLEEVTCLHGPRGHCQGVTVTGLRRWPAGAAYGAWRSGANGQSVSAESRDPCGQDGSAAGCARAAAGTVQAGATSGGTLDTLRGFAARTGNLVMDSMPVFWIFGAAPEFEWFPVPDSASGRLGALLGNAGYFAGGVAGAVRGVGAGVIKNTLASAGGVVRRFELPADRVFYRAFSDDATVGAWLTPTRPPSRAWAQEALALPPWNRATHVQEVLVPRGTLIERSRASQVPEWGRSRGGAEQFRLLETIPESSFGPGSPLP